MELQLNDSVELYHNNLKKFETTGVGVTMYFGTAFKHNS